MARYHSRGLVVPMLDGLLTQERCTRAELLECLDRMVGVPHVRRGLHLGDRHRYAYQLGVADVGLAQDLGERVAQHLAHPQLPLRGTFLR